MKRPIKNVKKKKKKKKNRGRYRVKCDGGNKIGIYWRSFTIYLFVRTSKVLVRFNDLFSQDFNLKMFLFYLTHCFLLNSNSGY